MYDRIGSVLKQKSPGVCALPPTASVYDAIELMSDSHVGSVLVMFEGVLLGIVSERDYARKVILKGKSSRETPVGEIMTSPVITVTPDHTVEECMRVMTEHRVRHLPVEDATTRRVVGVISIGDLVHWVITDQRDTIHHLEDYITGKYPA